MKFILLYFGLVLFTMDALAQQGGIQGEVLWLDGNQMPGPETSSSQLKGVTRELYIYKTTKLADVELLSNGLYSKINSEFVTKVLSHASGSFKVKLPPGEYSVFVKEPTGFFGNIFDSNGKINCVAVKSKKYSSLTIIVDYEAAY